MTTEALTLADFLLARIAEDEANIEGDWSAGNGGLHIIGVAMHARMLAECEAKRRIVEHCERDLLTLSPGDPYVLQLLASVYADHPDYRDEWRA